MDCRISFGDSVRAALIAGAMMLLSFGVARAADEVVKIDASLTGPQYVEQGKALPERGYQPVSVSAYDVAGEPHYAVVWQKRPQVAWAERHDLTAEDFQDNFDVMLGQGFRPISLSVSNTRGAVRYNAIWERSEGQVRYTGFGQSEDEHLKTVAVYQRDGYRPIAVNGFTINGEARFAAIWEKADGPAFEMQLDLTPQTLAASQQKLVPQGYRPVHVTGYEVAGKPHFTAIWEQRPGGEFDLRSDVKPEELQALPARMAQGGFFPSSFTAYTLAGKPRFVVIWEKPS